MRLVEAVDFIGRAGDLAEMQEAADMVILVEGAEDVLEFGAFEAEVGERSEERVASSDGEIFLDDVAQGHCDQIFRGCLACRKPAANEVAEKFCV